MILIIYPETERRELFRWILEVPYKEHRGLMEKDLFPESGLWLLRKKDFIEWGKASASSILWLHGIRMFSQLSEWEKTNGPYSWLRQE
jgi:hypothetical protein